MTRTLLAELARVALHDAGQGEFAGRHPIAPFSLWLELRYWVFRDEQVAMSRRIFSAVAGLVCVLGVGCAGDGWPKTYTVDANATAEQQATLRHGAEVWNRVSTAELGYEVFQGGEAVLDDPDWMISDTECGPGVNGCADSGGPHLWLSWTNVQPNLRLAVAAHEAGHVLGMHDLDCDWTAVMCGRPASEVTEADLEAFRRTAQEQQQ